MHGKVKYINIFEHICTLFLINIAADMPTQVDTQGVMCKT